VLRIILDAELVLALDEAVGMTLGALGHRIVKDPTAISTGVLDFFQDRMRVYFKEEGFRADQINAVLSRQPHQVLDARKRLEALSRFLTGHQAAEALAALIKRVNNLLRKENVEIQREPDPQLFEDPAEHQLWEHWQVMAGPVHSHLHHAQYASALDLLAGLRPSVDTFFDKVMVLAENPEIRQNRLALLTRLQDAFLRIADFTQLQGS
jgi:glycyl-tRNA synthetase beta chain